MTASPLSVMNPAETARIVTLGRSAEKFLFAGEIWSYCNLLLNRQPAEFTTTLKIIQAA
jgi:hypothetical protein